MSPNFEPRTPIEAYKAIIDQLVDETTAGVSERLLRESATYSKTPGDAVANGFVASLTPQQRGILADMLKRERESAIGGTLSVLTWWLLCRDVGLSFRGQPMPFELSGQGLHGDYVGRLNGWEWPSNDV